MSQNPTHPNLKPATQGAVPAKLFGRTKSLLKKLRWLSPVRALNSTASSAFGRNIERQLNGLVQSEEVLTLKLHRRDTAVVMSMAHYEEVLQMKAACTQLLQLASQRVIADAANDFEALYHRITSPASHTAAKGLLSVSPEELRDSYRPGDTETSP